MSKYAIIVTDSGLIPGSNGMLNSMVHYGMADAGVEFHYLWRGPRAKAYVDYITGISPTVSFFHPINIDDLMAAGYPKHPSARENAWYCKMYRYIYAVRELTDYDAVVIFDADMQIVNDIIPFFEFAASTGRLLLPNNDYSGQEYDKCVAEAVRGAASPPLHNMPSFFKPSEWVDVMEMIPNNSLELITGDMAGLSHALLRSGRMKDIHAQPNCLWVLSHFYNIHLHLRMINDRPYICLHKSGDRIYSFHRRWWMKSVCDKFVGDVKEPDNKIKAANNVNIFYQITCNLNKLYFPIWWDERGNVRFEE